MAAASLSCRPAHMEADMKRIIIAILTLLIAPALFAAGTLTAAGSGNAPIQIKEHIVNVVIDNGFARTEVVQTFFNPNDKDLEAVYGFPVPSSASLSEITIWNRERTLNGEVIEAQEAKKVYTEERDAGNDAGLGECSCTKNERRHRIQLVQVLGLAGAREERDEDPIRLLPAAEDRERHRAATSIRCRKAGRTRRRRASGRAIRKSRSTSPSTSSCAPDGRWMRCARRARTTRR